MVQLVFGKAKNKDAEGNIQHSGDRGDIGFQRLGKT
jgi:hypothetical protein